LNEKLQQEGDNGWKYFCPNCRSKKNLNCSPSQSKANSIEDPSVERNDCIDIIPPFTQNAASYEDMVSELSPSHGK
jgi:hypothetical protein